MVCVSTLNCTSHACSLFFDVKTKYLKSSWFDETISKIVGHSDVSFWRIVKTLTLILKFLISFSSYFFFSSSSTCILLGLLTGGSFAIVILGLVSFRVSRYFRKSSIPSGTGISSSSLISFSSSSFFSTGFYSSFSFVIGVILPASRRFSKICVVRAIKQGYLKLST